MAHEPTMGSIDVESPSHHDFLTLYEQGVSSIDEVCSMLGDDEWDLPTDCPGWTVKDVLSHLTHYESTAAGMPQPEVEVPEDLPYVRNDFGKMNEPGVHARRERPGAEVLDEFREATAARLASLRAEGNWDAPLRIPVGEFPMSRFAPIRLLDFFFHEQDIRRASGHAGHMDGALARFAFERMATVAAPRVIAKEAGVADGSTIAFEVPEPGRAFAVTVREGRGVVTGVPSSPDVRLSTDLETFLCLFGGRWSPARAVGEGRLKVEGDQERAKAVLDAIVVVP